MSREYNEEEVREMFIKKVNSLIEYWHKESRTPDTKDKLEGLAHSILVVIDGNNSSLPKFVLAPDPHPSDKQYHIDNRDNFFPENHASKINCDISGCLHELLNKYK